MKLLIVDDSAEMRRLLRTLLGDLASEVVECGGGREAVRLYFEERPDWVVMDLPMREGDGLTATREIRGRDSEARIVIVRQSDEDLFRVAANEAGAAAFMLKESLLSVRRFLSETPAR